MARRAAWSSIGVSHDSQEAMGETPFLHVLRNGGRNPSSSHNYAKFAY